MDDTDTMNDRTCIVTRTPRAKEELLRFVTGPDGTVVPDLKGNLPGRGCWVTASRRYVEEAVRKKAFARGLKAKVTVQPDLAERVDGLMTQRALGALQMARKAGQLVTGATKTDQAVRSGEALMVLHASDASKDGRRKIFNARYATAALDGPDIPALTLFSSGEMGLALGGDHVIHAALLGGGAGRAAVQRLFALARFRDDAADE